HPLTGATAGWRPAPIVHIWIKKSRIIRLGVPARRLHEPEACPRQPRNDVAGLRPAPIPDRISPRRPDMSVRSATPQAEAGTNFPTRIDPPADARAKLISLLNQQLADTFDLMSQTKFAHWNVKGPTFIALHKLFDKLAETLEGHVDEIAERATALG